MALNWNTFFTRLGSAIVFCLIMMAGLLWHTWAFLLLFLLITFLALQEYAYLVAHIIGTSFWRNVMLNYLVSGVLLFLVVASLPLSLCDDVAAHTLAHMRYYLFGLFGGALLVFFLFAGSKKNYYLLTGFGYIPLSLGLLVQLRYQSLYLPLILILMIWMNDTLAYLCGSIFGKRPFFPSISPKKTLEGTIGGMLFTMALAAVWGHYTNWFPMGCWTGLGLIASVAGTAGDLAESKLKRLAGVKDSGSLMPGHGGALDRFDSLLFAAPPAFLLSLIYDVCLPAKVF